MLLRRTGRTGQLPPPWLRAPRRATRWHARPASTPPRDWVQIGITVLPSIIAAIALIFTWRTVSATYGQLQTTQQGQITDRYNTAITHLADNSLEIRLGGIYALQRIMQDSPRDQPSVVAVLCAYVRDRANEVAAKSARSLTPPRVSPVHNQPPTDIQAVLTIVGTRNTNNDGSTTVIDLSNTDLAKADLSSMDLSGADLSGADLSNADLDSAHLRFATLIGAKLPKARLTFADLTFADLKQADFTDANLTNANLTAASTANTNFDNALLVGAKGL